MSHPFEMWSDRIAAATTDEARRELLVEAARWRAQHLSDVPAMRRATFVVSRLHAMLGDRGRAVSEAHQLLSLCQTTPEASGEEIEAARGYLQSLGESAPKLTVPRREREGGRDRDRDRDRGAREPRPRRERAPREARPEQPRGREQRPQEPRTGADLTEARRAAEAGDWSAALEKIGGAKGGAAALLRTYVQISAALASEDPLAAVENIRAELGRAAGLGKPQDGSDPLSLLLGAPVPSKRAIRVRLIEQFAADHPERIDDLASAALRQHVSAYGPGSPAPWLVGVVAQAMAGEDASQTRTVIEELRGAAAIAVQAYDEWPFERLLRLMRRAVASGASCSGMRRGVLARGEPDDRKLWTLRLVQSGTEAMLAVAPHASAPYTDGKAEELAARLVGLCPRAVLLATGSGNAGLRAAAAAAGVTVLEHDADDDALLVTLANTRPAGAPAPAPSAPDRISEILSAEPVDTEALTEAIRSFRRPDRALRVIQRLADELDDDRAAAVLRAVDAATDPDRAVPEATTLAIRAAMRGEQTRGLLTDGGTVAVRFGGPGIGEVIALADAVTRGGWDLFRVLRGPTRRECTAHPALETLSSSMSGLWRLLIRQGDRRGEVWFVAELAPEGRAGIPLLLLEDWQRVVVLPVDAELIGWWRTLGGPEPIGWTGAEGAEVVSAAESFVARGDHGREEDGHEATEGTSGGGEASPAP